MDNSVVDRAKGRGAMLTVFERPQAAASPTLTKDSASPKLKDATMTAPWENGWRFRQISKTVPDDVMAVC